MKGETRMFYAIRERTPITALPTDLNQIHLVRPISAKKLEKILVRCPQIQKIGASLSVEKRLAPNAQKLLQERKIIVTRVHRAGRALDIDPAVVTQIVDLKKDFLSLRAIAQKTGVPKSTIHYFLKKAKREKIKKGKNVIYVH